MPATSYTANAAKIVVILDDDIELSFDAIRVSIEVDTEIFTHTSGFGTDSYSVLGCSTGKILFDVSGMQELQACSSEPLKKYSILELLQEVNRR